MILARVRIAFPPLCIACAFAASVRHSAGSIGS
jgi:hypothetical protein